MIHADHVMPLLVGAVPSFEHDPIHAEDDGTRLHYLDAGAVARQLLDLQRSGLHEDLRAAFGVIESLHSDGDDYVRELATIGHLEGVQNACSHADDVSATDFEPYLGAESRRWWRGLDGFWSGRAPVVEAVEAVEEES